MFVSNPPLCNKQPPINCPISVEILVVKGLTLGLLEDLSNYLSLAQSPCFGSK